MSKVNPFRAAKPYLNTGTESSEKTRLICFALRVACDRGEFPIGEFRTAKSMIERRLGDHSTMHNWLSEVAKIPDDQLTFRAVQLHRHAWIGILAAEWDAGKRR